MGSQIKKYLIFGIFFVIFWSQPVYADTPSVTNVKFDKTYYYPGDQLVVSYDIRCSNCRVTWSGFYIKDIGSQSGSGSGNLGVSGGSKVYGTKLPENIREGTLNYIIDVEWHDRHPDYINFPVEYDKQLDTLKSGSITIKKKPVVTQAPTTAPPTSRPTTTTVQTTRPPTTTDSTATSASTDRGQFPYLIAGAIVLVLLFLVWKFLSPSKKKEITFCPNCGNQIKDTDKFCRKCGNKI